MLSPHVLLFFLGLCLGCVCPKCTFPKRMSTFFMGYMMCSVGLKGGMAMSSSVVCFQFIVVAVVGLMVGFLQPFVSYFILRRLIRLDGATASALAAHYGSVSMVTFLTAMGFLRAHGVGFAGYMSVVAALMEVPAIVSGLWIARHWLSRRAARSFSWRSMVQHSVFLLLMGAFGVGWLVGPLELLWVAGCMDVAFQVVLGAFLLDMGLLVAKQIADIRGFSIGLVLFGIYMPVLHAFLGLALSRFIGLDVGTGFLWSVLLGGSSYIVVTAVMRRMLPDAKVAIYLPMSLAITFPFNVVVGIPLYFRLAMWLLG